MQTTIRLLYLCDTPATCLDLPAELPRRGFDVQIIRSLDGLRAALQENSTSLILSDWFPFGLTALKLLNWLSTHHVHLPVVFLGDPPTPETAIQAMREGAADVIPQTPETLKTLPRRLRAAVVRHAARKPQPTELWEDINKKLHNVLDHRLYSYVLVDNNLIARGFNQPAQDMARAFLGRELNIGVEFATFFNATLKEQFMNLVESALGGDAVRHERRFQQDNTVRWFDFSGSPILDANHQIVGACLIAVDITDQKYTEDALRTSEESLRTFINAMPETAMLMDPDGVILAINNASAGRMGKTPAEVTGTKFDVDLPPEWAERRRKRLQEALQTGQPVHYESERNGRSFETNIYPVVATDGQVVRVAVYGLDTTDRKRSEEALRQSEATLRALVNASPEATYLLDTDGVILAANEALAARLETALEELIGHSLYDFLPAASVELRREAAEQAINHKQPSFLPETRLGRSYETYYYPIVDSQGHAVRLAVFSTDVTERKRSEEALNRRDAILETVSFAAEQFMRAATWEEKIDEVLSNLGQALDVSRVYLYKNRVHTDGLIYSTLRSEWNAPGVQSQRDELNPEFHLARTPFARWEKLLSRGEMVTGHIRNLPKLEQQALKSQKIHSILVAPIFVQKTWWGFIGFNQCDNEREWINTEIEAFKTAVRILEAAIQKNEAQTAQRAMLSAMPDLMLRLDRAGTLLEYYSPAPGHPMLTANEFIGQTFPQQLHPQFTSEIMARILRILDSGEMEVFDFETQISEPRAWEARIVMTDEDSVLAIIRDITERRRTLHQLETYTTEIAQTNLELAAARDEALETARLKTEFLTTMSHEIRTPMNAVMGMAELLQGTQQNPEQREYTDVIQNSAWQLLTLLNNTLDLSKIEAGYLTLEQVVFCPQDLFNSVAGIFQHHAQLKQLRLEVTLSAQMPPRLRGDPLRLRQVLSNLISNALKFTDAGYIQVRVSVVDETENDLLLMVQVRDSGIGLTENARKRLFQPFTQADGSTTRKYGGSGLGLAISRRLVELMSGEIGVESIEGKGSAFWFTITLGRCRPDEPLAPDSSIPTPLPTRLDYQPRRIFNQPNQKVILLAEDNPANQHLSTIQLQKMGYAVQAVGTGKQAVDMLLQRPDDFAAVIMDLQMPDMDGLTATRLIRKAEQQTGRHLPIIAMTANALLGDRETCLQAGMDDYLSKPVSFEQLRRKVNRWSGRAGTDEVETIEVPNEERGKTGPLDPRVLDSLRSLQEANGGDVFIELSSMYLHDAPLLMARAHTALTAGDAMYAREAIHNLKGISGNLGANRLVEQLDQLERMLANQAVEGALKILPVAEMEFQRALDALENERHLS